jgi:glutamate synthase (ferredoxin)
VRNSGVHAVVEAVGDHGCEYMTGGRVVILGPTGRNFAAGMSGGVAFVLDEKGDFATRCNKQMVALEGFADGAEKEEVRQMIQRHAELTNSQRAWKILALWPAYSEKFVKVMPKDYKRVLQSLKEVKERGLSGEEAIMAAFEANARDEARLGGG